MAKYVFWIIGRVCLHNTFSLITHFQLYAYYKIVVFKGTEFYKILVMIYAISGLHSLPMLYVLINSPSLAHWNYILDH